VGERTSFHVRRGRSLINPLGGDDAATAADEAHGDAPRRKSSGERLEIRFKYFRACNARPFVSFDDLIFGSPARFSFENDYGTCKERRRTAIFPRIRR